MELTQWFEHEVSPTVPGWYERDYKFYLCDIEHDYWDGQSWRVGLGDGAYSSMRSPSKLRWRGLSEKYEVTKNRLQGTEDAVK